MESSERVQNMQAALEEAEILVKKFEDALKDFEKGQAIIKKVSDYYGHEDWFKDKQVHEDKRFEVDYNTSILGEDEPFYLLVANQQLAIEMLEIATDMIKAF